jgi:hypothetical protein
MYLDFWGFTEDNPALNHNDYVNEELEEEENG